ncbi:MAG: HEAT repeat domain-containing protein [Ekhidna sp.]|nr:HEAT repeat domain-containing protein [Ekhidna sp.]
MNTWSHHKETVLEISLAFFAGVLLIFCFIIIRRAWMMAEHKVRIKHASLFIKLIIQFVHESLGKGLLSSSKYYHRLKFFTKGQYPKRILLNTLSDFAKKFRGPYHQCVVDLYDHLELSDQSMKNVTSSNPNLVIDAIREMNLFGQTVNDEVMIKLLSSPDRNIREEALALLFHYHKTPFELIEQSTLTMSTWQQVMILDNLSKLAQEQLPDLTPALETSNNDLKSFALYAIGELKLEQYFFRMLRMMKCESPGIRYAITKTIGRFDGERYKSAIKQLLTDADPKVKSLANYLWQRNKIKEANRIYYASL